MRAWVLGVVAVAACGPWPDEVVPAADVSPARRVADGLPEERRLPRERELHLRLPEDPPPPATHPHPNARFIQVAAAQHDACGVMSDRTLWCWGESGPSGLRQLGADADWSFVAKERSHACAIKLDGTLWCWGAPYEGQLGIGPTAEPQVAAPTQVGTATGWRTVAVTEASTCGLRTDGTLWCWGRLIPVEWGDSFARVDRPALISSNGSWRSLSLGHHRLCTVDDVGSAECWSQTYGDGRYTLRHDAIPASWRQFDQHTGLRADGTLWRGEPWSLSKYGMDDGWVRLERDLVLRSDRTLWRAVSPEPVLLSSEAWLDVSDGGHLACGVRADGSTWCWTDSADPTRINP
jgi:hypothetical protein